MRPLVVVCILLAAGLAGCSGTDAPESNEAVPAPSVETGGIRCIVVDAAINPIPNATIQIVTHDTTVHTDDDGECVIPSDLPPPYIIHVDAPGYERLIVQVTEDHFANGPPVLRLQLAPASNTAPYWVEDKFDGLVACSARLPTGGFNDGCGAFGDTGLGSTQRKRIEMSEGNLDWVQTELVWVPNGPTTQTLCTRAHEADLFPIGDVCAESSIVRYLDDVQVTADAIDRGQWFEYIVFPNHAAPINETLGTGGVAVQQEFQLFTHGFYNMQPAPGWQFSSHGAPDS